MSHVPEFKILSLVLIICKTASWHARLCSYKYSWDWLVWLDELYH